MAAEPMTTLLIDNHDSNTFNLFQLLAIVEGSEPVVVRNDPMARDLVLTLDRRAKRRVWELDSLRNRFGIGGQGPHSVDN